ncbi:MAG: hypothetical protein SGI94_04585 [Saprospiraceae bacterium]|nr:hypothetical protein [Saprospiraceae bacterium]
MMNLTTCTQTLRTSAFLFVLAVVFSACKGTQYTPANLPEQQLAFGDGGGFAGAYTEYLLLENGQLFVQKGLGGERVEIPSTKKRTAKAMFKQASVLLTDSTAFNYPGNMYYFLHRKDTGVDIRLTWGAPGYEVNGEVKALYEQMLKLPPPATVEK